MNQPENQPLDDEGALVLATEVSAKSAEAPPPPGAEVVVRYTPPLLPSTQMMRCQAGCMHRFRYEDRHMLDIAIIVGGVVVAKRTALVCSETCATRIEKLWRGLAAGDA